MDSGLFRTRWWRPVTFVAAAAIAITACSTGNNQTSSQKAPANQQVYRVNDGTEPNSFDPGQQTYTYEAAFGRNVFQPLLGLKQDLSDVEPLTADSYKVSSDGLTYTFHIRNNAKWSDGKAVTAQDFVYGWQRLLNPALAAGYVDPFFDNTVAGGQDYGNVSPTDAGAIDKFLAGLGLSAPDAQTFQVKLQKPFPSFKYVATLWVGAPIRKDLVEGAAGGSFPSTDTTKGEAWAQDPTKIVGNGPFVATEHVAKDHLTLVPNKYYWNGQATIQKLTMYFIEDANTAYSQYKTGALDQITVPAALSSTVQNDSKLKNELIKIPVLTTFWMSYNLRNPILANKQVRMALAKSIDRGKLAADVEHGQARATTSFIPQGMPGHDESAGSAQKYDPSAAKQMLQQSGVTAQQLSGLKLLTRNTTRNKTINEFIAAQWKANLGVDIALEVIDSKTVTSRIRKAQFDIYGPDGWGADYPDQQDWYDIWLSSVCGKGFNWGCWKSTEYDSLVTAADGDLNNSDRSSKYSQAQKILLDDAGVGMLFQTVEWDIKKSYVQVQYTNIDDQGLPGDLRYHDAYITSH